MDSQPEEGKNSNKKMIIIVVVAVVIILIAVGIILYIVLSGSDKKSEGETYTITIDGQEITYNTVNLIQNDTEYNEGTFESTSADQNVFLVVDGTLTLGPGVLIKKTGEKERNNILTEKPDNDDPPTPPGPGPTPPEPGPEPGGDDNYSFFGTNSAIVVLGSGKAVINGISITTEAYGANAVIAVNNGTVDIKNSTIRTTKDASRGLHATYKGKITASEIDIATQGVSCANLATDRGQGTVIADNVKLSTSGAGSPLLYSTGDIHVTNSSGTATGAQIACIEGINSITINNCDFSATGTGKNGDVDSAGVMIYQSMSGDAEVGVGTFNAYDSNLKITESERQNVTAFFFVTNTEAVVLLNGTSTTSLSGIYLNVSGTDTWGEEGKNGGNVNMTIVNNKQTGGKIRADNISSVVIYYDNSVQVDQFDLVDGQNVTLKHLQ